MQVVITQIAFRLEDGRSNIGAARRLLRPLEGRLGRDDVVVLPELVGGEAQTDQYEAEIRSLADHLGAWVVGGSHFARNGSELTNSGVVADPRGEVAGRYGKLNPYGAERAQVTRSGHGPLVFRIGEISCLVMVCADFWHSTAFHVAGAPPADLILVPAFSVSQRPEPYMARARWRHAAVSRAYEFAAYVAVSDWAYPVRFPDAGCSSGIAGLAHPNPALPSELYRALGRRRAANFSLDMDSVRDLRANRNHRGFDLGVRSAPNSGS